MQTIIWLVAEFLALFLVAYALNLAAYFAICSAIDYVNRRNPERRIQKKRRGEKRIPEEIRHSIKSIAVTALSLSIGLFASFKGWTIFPALPFSWWTAVPLFLLCMILFDAWFYFGHRLLHTKPFYKFHLLHHRSVAPTAWSTDSIGAVDTAICQGFYAVIPFFIPFPPALLIAHRLFDHVNGALGHAGFEYFASRTARYPFPMLCATYHDLHHSEFKYNYANYFSIWDRVMGTAHPSYDKMVEDFEANPPPLRLTGPAIDDPALSAKRPSPAE